MYSFCFRKKKIVSDEHFLINDFEMCNFMKHKHFLYLFGI